MNFISEIEKMIHDSHKAELNWEEIAASPIGYFLQDMKKIPQNPKFHGEGDVYIHTQLVCGELIKLPDFWKLDQTQMLGVFIAAILHDIGKIRTTRMEDGEWVSPHHSSTGSLMAREFLWRTCGLCGCREKQQLRELICTLIRYHMIPVHLLDTENAERKARELAANGELVPGFSWSLLCLLSEADMRGRIVSDTQELLEKIELCRAIAEEAQCLDEPYSFNDAYTKHAYLSGRNVAPHQSLYHAAWGEVILLSGLPGTGKDTWIREHLPEYPMISLDEIRSEMKIKPTDNQGIIIQEAQERAKVYLRKHQPFVWNATNITRDTRQKQISLFERYGASVRIIYLETDWSTQIQRNSGREAEVPAEAIEKMLRKTVPPMPEEAETVEWILV